jgi:DNA-binding PadR family transcriptional regulator
LHHCDAWYFLLMAFAAAAYTANVSKTPDKRRRRDLDLFILALIDSGVSTPYELQQAAGLSPGATIPVLHRLLECGLVLAGKPGTRGRIGHKLTPAGRARLKHGWKELIADGPSCDLDADLRVALLALFVGADRRVAIDFLHKSAARKLESLAKIENAERAPSLPPLAFLYKNLRAASAKALIKAEATAAADVARSLSRAPALKRARSPRKLLKRT